jgi:hypothetical protein
MVSDMTPKLTFCPACGVPPPWQHSDSAVWYNSPSTPPCDIVNDLTAAEHLLGYSQSHITLFKRNQLEPIKDLKLLVKDYAPIAKNALTILINISSDAEVLKSLAKDDALLETLLSRITVCQFTDT